MHPTSDAVEKAGSWSRSPQSDGGDQPEEQEGQCQECIWRGFGRAGKGGAWNPETSTYCLESKEEPYEDRGVLLDHLQLPFCRHDVCVNLRAAGQALRSTTNSIQCTPVGTSCTVGQEARVVARSGFAGDSGSRQGVPVGPTGSTRSQTPRVGEWLSAAGALLRNSAMISELSAPDKVPFFGMRKAFTGLRNTKMCD